MGLTIHYDLKSSVRSAEKAKQLVEKMRSLAMDLPFENVGDLICCSGPECDFQQYERGDDRRGFLSHCRTTIPLPWNKNHYIDVIPEHVFGFDIQVGDGSEYLQLGLMTYPSTAVAEYRVDEDTRFFRKPTEGEARFTDWKKWTRWRDKHYPNQYMPPQKFTEKRSFKTGKTGWCYDGFCKTQYASNPKCGGLPNFLRCHVSVITLLEQIAKLPGIRVVINDEGRYGPAKYSDDYKEAKATGQQPTYVWHPATHSIKVLTEEVGDYNVLIASMAGALKDAMGPGQEVLTPISDYPDFEQLEFSGQNNEAVQPFLNAMTKIAAQNRAKIQENDNVE